MPRQIAFLRAINVGGHTVTMDRLRRVFEEQGLDQVETFIASGNVVFETKAAAGAKLEARLETALRKALGYEVATFLRTPAELASIAKHEPFESASGAISVGFLRAAPAAVAKRRLMALRTANDDFHVRGRELWWRSLVGQGKSKISGAVMERALEAPTTLRGVNTVRRMAAKFAPPRG